MSSFSVNLKPNPHLVITFPWLVAYLEMERCKSIFDNDFHNPFGPAKLIHSLCKS